MSLTVLATSGNNVWSSLRLRELRELLEAQGAMRASRAYREADLVPEPDVIRLEVSGKCSIEY
jgi:hypothetical protein